MSSKLIVSISDLHLGRGNAQDSFCGPHAKYQKRIDELAQALGRAGTEYGTGVTLVLNGDIFDMWELVTDQELGDTPAALRAIRRGLLVPVRDQAGLNAIEKQAADRLTEALDAHDEFVRMLKTVVDGGGTVHYNAGNHDHRFSHPCLQAVLLRALNARGITLTSGVYYRNTQLGFYAEHGDQFSDEDSRSPHSVNPIELDEARGFYFLRYVWNRVENREHNFSPRGDLVGVLDIVRRIIEGGASERFLKYLFDYFTAVRDEKIPLVTDDLVERAYVKWLGSGTVEKAAAHRTARPMRDVEPAKPIIRPDAPDWLPGVDVAFATTGSSPYLDGLCHRYSVASAPFPRLQPGVDRILALGHTHEATMASLQYGGTVHAEYLNTGSWTRGEPMRYAWVYKKDDQPPVCGIRSLTSGFLG